MHNMVKLPANPSKSSKWSASAQAQSVKLRIGRSYFQKWKQLKMRGTSQCRIATCAFLRYHSAKSHLSVENPEMSLA